jgi:hypothetical protein
MGGLCNFFSSTASCMRLPGLSPIQRIIDQKGLAPCRSAGFPAKNRISMHFQFCWRHRQSPQCIGHLTSRDGICSIIYKIIMGIELYNNNGRSIIIIFNTLYEWLCRESCIKYSKCGFIHPSAVSSLDWLAPGGTSLAVLSQDK